MPPAIWGVFTSLCWGAGDLAARYNGKRIGVANALFAMMLLSTLLLVAAELSFGDRPNFSEEGLVDLLIGSVLVLIATAALFAALVLGPISVAAPIASSYPVVTLTVAIASGVVPTLWQGVAMAAVLIGVWALALAGRNLESGGERPPGGVARTVVYSLISALTYGLSIEFLKGAYAIHGPIWTVIWLRLICLFLMLGYFALVLRTLPRFPKTLIPMLTFQGFVDGGGYVFLLIGAALPGGEIAVVVTAGYAVVSSLLARVLLKEMIGLTQGLAIVTVVGAVTYLAAG